MAKMNLYTMKPHILCAERVVPGMEVYNWTKGKVDQSSKRRPILLTGTKNEQWIISIHELVSKYTLVDGRRIIPQKLPRKFYITPILSGEIVYAHQVNQNVHITIKTVFGEVTTNSQCIPHGNGDFIVYPLDANGIPTPHGYIVNGFIFFDIYKEVRDKSDEKVKLHPHRNSHYAHLLSS